MSSSKDLKQTDNTGDQPQKRKRRTKAEIRAEKQAAKQERLQNPTVPSSPAVDHQDLVIDKSDSGLNQALGEPIKQEPLGNTEEGQVTPVEIPVQKSPKEEKTKTSSPGKINLITTISKTKLIRHPNLIGRDINASSFELDGFHFKAREGCDRDTIRSIFQGEYALPDPNFYEDHGLVFDIGSYLGGYSMWAAKCWGGCKALAVEPLPENIDLILQNIKLNTLDDRVKVIQGAVGTGEDTEEGERMDIAYPVVEQGGDDGLSGFNHRFIGSPSNMKLSQQKVSVPVFTLADLLKIADTEFDMGGRQIHCAKIDCEMGEYGFLNRASNEELSRLNWIIGEYHNGIEGIFERMSKAPFTLIPLNGDISAQKRVDLFLYKNNKLPK